MPDLQTALQSALIKTTLNAWDAHEDQIRKPQQEKQMANPNPVINHEAGKGFTPSNNVMRATFDAVKNAPKMKHKEYVEMLALNGYKINSTSAVLYQLMRAGQIARDEQGQLSVTCAEYQPIKQVKKQPRVIVLDKAPEPKPRQIVLVKKPRDKSEGIAALKADTGGPGLPNVEKFDMGKFTHHAPRAFHPSAIVDNLSVLHARELYDYLKKIFGGN
jgi:hypothetical protein